MAKKAVATVNSNGTVSFNNSVGITTNNTTVVPMNMSPNITSSNTPAASTYLFPSGIGSSNVAQKIASTHTWPKRHTHRCGVYHHNIMKMHQKFTTIEMEINLHKKDPKVHLKYWSNHEIEVFMRIKKDLEDLYNNRFIEYTKMIAEEKGYDVPNLESTTKFKLK